MYYLFYRYNPHHNWTYADEFETSEECQEEMTQTGEPEYVEYMIIKGKGSSYEQVPAICPYTILEDK